MKKLALLFVFVNSLVFAQGEQRYADGTATDQDGNTFEWINYGTQDWAIENAEVVTYRDGTPIPQVTDATEWANLTTGAWCYYDNDPTKARLYNWYAVMGIHDNDENTANKEFGPMGWHVATDAEWTELENYLIANGYNYDGTIIGNKIAKSMASTTGWNSSTETGAIGNDQSLNNSSGFNAFPEGNRNYGGSFGDEGNVTIFWSSVEGNTSSAWGRNLNDGHSYLLRSDNNEQDGLSVRFVREASDDAEPPVFTLLGDNPISVNQGDTYTDPGATATDNVDGDLTFSIVVSGTVDTSTPGTYIVTYSVTDSAGNTSTVTRTVIVLDTQPPIITILGANPITVNQGATYTDPGVTVSDNVDGDLTSSIVVSGTVDTDTPGTYYIYYNVTDSAGNAANQATRTVYVVETTPTVNAGPDLSVCQGETVTLGEATASNVSSVIWTTSGDGVFYNPSIINPTYIPGPADIANGSFLLELSGQGYNGQVFIDSVWISITSLPTVSAGPDLEINEGVTFQLSEATASNYSSVFWTTTGTGAFSYSQTINPSYTLSQNDIHTGYVDLIITAHPIAPCVTSVSDMVRVTINLNPTVDAGPDLSICEGNSVTITGASASNISSFFWEILSGTGTLTDTTALTPTYTPSLSDIANGIVTLRLTAYGTNNQQVSDEIEIVIEPCNTDILLNGTISAENNQIKNVADPTDAKDAVTKNYTDTKFYTQIEVDAIISSLQEQIDALKAATSSGTVIDQDGNSYLYLTYGEQVWTVKNAEVVTYRDGTPIPQVTDASEWANLTTGAWCYYDNDPTKGKLYNWYAVAGIHDTDPNTPNKEFAPEGWHVPTDAEWTTLENYLIAKGYNYDGTTTENKIAKSMASTTGWNSSAYTGAIGNDQSLNNSSGFNAIPEGHRWVEGLFEGEGYRAVFWSSTEWDTNYGGFRTLSSYRINLSMGEDFYYKHIGNSVRFVKD